MGTGFDKFIPYGTQVKQTRDNVWSNSYVDRGAEAIIADEHQQSEDIYRLQYGDYIELDFVEVRSCWE
jgi:hypothetical protein